MKKTNLLAASLFLLTGCASDSALQARNQELTINHLRQQDFRRAQELENLSFESAGEHNSQNLLLDASESYLRADATDKALELLQRYLNKSLTFEQENRKNILLAKAALAKGNAAVASNQLKNIWTPNKLSPSLQKDFYTTRAAMHKLDSDSVEATKDLITAAKLLTDQQEIQENNQQIAQALMQLTPKALAELLENDANSNQELIGWVEFVKISKQYDYGAEQTERAYKVWQQRFNNHPANSLLPTISSLPTEAHNDSVDDDYTKQQWFNKIRRSQNLDLNKVAASKYKNSIRNAPPEKIALILPLHGKYAPSAKAVRDGFLAAHFESQNKIKIQVYDSMDGNIVEKYKQALAEGAEFIVGPLMKQDVEKISGLGELKVPVLALNDANERHPNNLFQFGLSPETEAEAVADKAWLDGRRTAITIYPNTEWGNRVRQAFEKRWKAIGGKIVGHLELNSDIATLSKDIKNVLHVEDSEQRANQLKKLGLKFGFQAKRRKDLDMVYIATNAEAARQVKPLLNYHFANDLPAYATSSIFSGISMKSNDQDLNGIIFCDMPWILDKTIMAKASYKKVSNLWPQEFEKYMRLYALGLDAYKIALQLSSMTKSSTLGVSGMTGMLRINSNNNKIYRELMWAEFKNGEPALQGQGKFDNGQKS
jgi:outer membrane PBP1 activator LpoA protein